MLRLFDNPIFPYLSVEFTNTCIYTRQLTKVPVPPKSHGVKRAKVRGDNIESVRKTFSRLKRIINSNYELPEQVRFITLTYAENMQENERIRRDMDKFFRKLRRAFDGFEYIYVKEKQERGAWHVHLILFFDGVAPYMENGLIRGFWGHGFINVQAIRGDVNNLGNYLCAYLTDGREDGKKGARLVNYASNIRLYNCSRGIKRPVRVVFVNLSSRVLEKSVLDTLPPLEREAVHHIFSNFHDAPLLSEREASIITCGSSPLSLRAAVFLVSPNRFTYYMLCKPARRTKHERC